MPRTRLDLIHRTSVRKREGRWWCSYVIPYGGALEAGFATWQEAMDDACRIEEARPWM